MGTEPAHGASLTEIAVTGFRGIGPRRALTLQPGPGLTLVVGRNGSGKSSFAEGLEILLTGSNWRWAHRSNVWREGWRNLHAPDETTVEATFAVEGEAGAVTLARTWPDGASLEGSTLTVKAPSKRSATLGDLGWVGALEPYRPFLSYNELGSMFDDGPTKLHDRLLAILGLGEYDAQAADLRARRLELDKAVRDAKGRLPGLLARLDTLRDPRAQGASAALKKRVWDLDAAEKAAGTVSGTGEETAQLEILRDLERLPAPGIEETLQLSQILRELISRTRALEKTPAGRAGDLAGILRAALAFHGKHQEATCPVCGTDGVLDQAWRDGAETQVRELDQLSTEWQDLMRLQRDANAHAHRIQSASPAVLTRAGEVGLARDAGILITAWNTFAERPDGGARELADHLEATIDPVVAAAETLREAARAELDRREGVWRPIAQELTRWLLEARPAVEGQARSDAFKREEQRLKDEQARLKSERFEPIADRAIAYWNVLRHQSNVELERIVLEGEGTKRRVDMSVTVDGVEGAALGVMSQGELHAIALSLFLPRATLDDSPFRFVVIDDPVQSMDPARVDGLARVLEDVASSRQVIVFTHDDRLPEAIRRLGIDAHVLEVTRREGSVVEVREGRDPVSRNLADAGDLASSRQLPPLLAQQVVPGFLRGAIEAACVEVVRRRRLDRGETHASVETLLASNSKTASLLSLALFDTASKGADVAPTLRKWGSDLVDAYQVAKGGAHAGYHGDLEALVRDVRALCHRIQALK